MPIKSRHHAQFCGRTRPPAHCLGNSPALTDAGRLADRQFVAFGDGAALVATQGADAVCRAAAQRERHVDASGDRKVDTGAGLQISKAQNLSRLYLERGPRRLLHAVDFDRHLSAGHRDDGIFGELKLRTDEDSFKAGGTLIVANEQVCRAQRQIIHRAPDWNAEMEIAGTTQILDRRRQTFIEYFNGHGVRPRVWRCIRLRLSEILSNRRSRRESWERKSLSLPGPPCGHNRHGRSI